MSRDVNFYEDVVNIVSERANRLIDTVAPLVMGGSTPPFTKALHTDQQIRDYWDRLEPPERQQEWVRMDEEDKAKYRWLWDEPERQRVTGIMRGAQQTQGG